MAMAEKTDQSQIGAFEARKIRLNNRVQKNTIDDLCSLPLIAANQRAKPKKNTRTGEGEFEPVFSPVPSAWPFQRLQSLL